MSHSSNKCNSRPEIMEKLGYIYQKEQRGNKCRKNYSFWCFCVLEVEGTFKKFGDGGVGEDRKRKIWVFFWCYSVDRWGRNHSLNFEIEEIGVGNGIKIGWIFQKNLRWWRCRGGKIINSGGFLILFGWVAVEIFGSLLFWLGVNNFCLWWADFYVFEARNIFPGGPRPCRSAWEHPM